MAKVKIKNNTEIVQGVFDVVTNTLKEAPPGGEIEVDSKYVNVDALRDVFRDGADAPAAPEPEPDTRRDKKAGVFPPGTVRTSREVPDPGTPGDKPVTEPLTVADVTLGVEPVIAPPAPPVDPSPTLSTADLQEQLDADTAKAEKAARDAATGS